MPKPVKSINGRSNNARGADRKKTIFKSLHDCILAKGYVRTTLKDIAEDAGMSASHLLYYFDGKEAILEQYFEEVSIKFMEHIEKLDALPIEDHIDQLADFWFLSKKSTRKEIGFMLECFGAAVNDDELKVTKADFDRRCKAHLARLFGKPATLQVPSIHDAAELCYALMIGLRSAVYFDDDISLDDAHRLFRQSARHFCGLPT